MKHTWVKLSSLSDNKPKVREIRKFKSLRRHSIFWRRKGWKFHQANKIFPAGWRKKFGNETCIARCFETSHKSITYTFFWMPRYKAIYPPKPFITENAKKLSKLALADRVYEYWGEKLMHLTHQQANCIDKALNNSLAN